MDETQLQIAIEEFYAGGMLASQEWEATEDYTLAERNRYIDHKHSQLKDHAIQQAYKAIAVNLYSTRPCCVSTDPLMQRYLAGISDLLYVFSADERFNRLQFLDSAGLEEIDGRLHLLPF